MHVKSHNPHAGDNSESPREMGSSIRPRTKILTPTWKALPHRPLSPLAREDAISEDDTDDEVYISLHEEAAQAERTRVTGPLHKSQKRSSLATVFPGPLECFRITETARKKHEYSDQDSDLKCVQMRENLHKFSAPLQAFSAIEALLQAEKAKLSRALAKLSLLNIDIEQNRGKNSSLSCCPNSIDALHPEKKNKTLACLPRECSPISATSIEGFLMKKAIARLERLEDAFEHTSKGMYAALEEFLTQANLVTPTEKSFVKLQSSFEEARMTNDSMRLGTTRLSLSELIKAEINANGYPLLSESFQLNAGYQIEGRERDDTGSRRRRRKRSSYPKTILNGLHKGKLHSNGFTLDLNLFKQNDNHQNISNPKKTPNSGIQTPASQPSMPSSLRKVNIGNAMHVGDLHFKGPTHHLWNDLCKPTVAHQGPRQNGESGSSNAQRSGMLWGNPLRGDAEIAQYDGRRTAAEPKHQSENVEKKFAVANDPEVLSGLKNVLEQQEDRYEPEHAQDIEPRLGNPTEVPDSMPFNPKQQREWFGIYNADTKQAPEAASRGEACA